MSRELIFFLPTGQVIRSAPTYYHTSSIWVCRQCGEVYAKVICTTDGKPERFEPRQGLCLKCPAWHPMAENGYISGIAWEADWPEEVLLYTLSLLFKQYDKGTARCQTL